MDPAKSADITGLDIQLIYRFKVILEALTSGHKINTEVFKKYCEETAHLYIDLCYQPYTNCYCTVQYTAMHSYQLDNCRKKQQKQETNILVRLD